MPVSSLRCRGVSGKIRSTKPSNSILLTTLPCKRAELRADSASSSAATAIAVPLVATITGVSPGFKRRSTLSTDGSKEPWIKALRKSTRSRSSGSRFTKSRCKRTAPTRALVRARASLASAKTNSVEPPPISRIRWGLSLKSLPERTPK